MSASIYKFHIPKNASLAKTVRGVMFSKFALLQKLRVSSILSGLSYAYKTNAAD